MPGADLVDPVRLMAPSRPVGDGLWIMHAVDRTVVSMTAAR